MNRRMFLSTGAAFLSGTAITKAGAASLPEAPTMESASTQAPLAPPNGRPYNPVVTLNGWTLPW
jgi:manganese oxidase